MVLANIKWPVAVTKSVWLRYIEWSWSKDDNKKQVHQNTETRLINILSALSSVMKETKSETDIITFEQRRQFRNCVTYRRNQKNMITTRGQTA